MLQARTVPKSNRRKLALLLPGHNEELIIATTIRSAVAAGQRLEDIYVVDDDSSDKTSEQALTLLPAQNVFKVPRSGKAKAVYRAIRHFELVDRYTWLHIADADSVFGPQYFKIYRKALHGEDYAAAVGFVQSMRGNWIAHYRCFSYTYGQHLFRRLQSWFGVISVLPGPVTCFRTDVIPKLDFLTESLTEDFDLTLQIHRKKLGKIKFIPEAVNYTQDPRTLKDFYRQTLRWQRGFFQGVRKYKIGLLPRIFDASVAYQILEAAFYFLTFAVVLPVTLLVTHDFRYFTTMIVGDFGALAVLALLSALAAGRFVVLLSLPYFYFLRIFELTIFIQAFFEVIVRGGFKGQAQGWDTEGRRYALDEKVLQDIAGGANEQAATLSATGGS